MEYKLQQLTQKIYQDGIEKADGEAKAIIEKANSEAKKILEDAKAEAASLKASAEKEAKQLAERTESEIKVAGSQAISSLQQKIVEVLSKNTLSTTLSSAVNNKELIVNVVKEIASKWNQDSLDLNVVLSEKTKSEFETFFKTEASDLLKKGVELEFENRMSGGFKIVPKDGSFVLSFTEEDFTSFFQSFLRPKAKEILFPGA